MNKFKRSLLPESLRGTVIFYTGQAGAGKTIGSMLDPDTTFFIDADHRKGQEMARSKTKMIYRAVNSDDRENIVKAGELFVQAVQEIDHKKITVVVIDNLYEVEQGLHAYAIANPVKVAKMFNMVAGKITGRQWGQDTLAHERILKGVVDELLANDITVVITAHMKPKFGVIGQLEIRGRNWIYEAASLVGIMIRTDAAPDVLVFKNAFNYHVSIDTDELSDEQFEQYRSGQLETSKVYQRIPRRIPAFSPTKLYRYLARTPEQIASRPYGPEEILDEDEMAPYMEILTKQQRVNVDKIMEQEQKERERFEDFEANMKESLRVDLDQAIIDNKDMEMADLLGKLKKEFDLFAAEITPIYIMQVRQR